MSSLANTVHLIGHLGVDPEVKQIESGRSMAKFSLATNETYKNSKGEKVTETQWHNLVAWGKTADRAGKYLKKGSELAVEGKINTRTYNDKDGKKVYFTEIVINDFMMLGPKDRN